MTALLEYVESLLPAGNLTLTKISLKEGNATLQFSYAGADFAKVRERLASQEQAFNTQPGNSLAFDANPAGGTAFTIVTPKANCKQLLIGIKQQALDLAERIAAEKKARRKKKKAPEPTKA